MHLSFLCSRQMCSRLGRGRAGFHSPCEISLRCTCACLRVLHVHSLCSSFIDLFHLLLPFHLCILFYARNGIGARPLPNSLLGKTFHRLRESSRWMWGRYIRCRHGRRIAEPSDPARRLIVLISATTSTSSSHGTCIGKAPDTQYVYLI